MDDGSVHLTEFHARGAVVPSVQVWKSNLDFEVRATHSSMQLDFCFTNVSSVALKWSLQRIVMETRCVGTFHLFSFNRLAGCDLLS